MVALTYDIGIHISEEKYGNCNGKHQEEEGAALAKELLHNLGFDKKVSERVQHLIAHHHSYTNVEGMDYQILVLFELVNNAHSIYWISNTVCVSI